jgi:hypothetical protein
MQTLRHLVALGLLLAPLPALAAGESIPLAWVTVPFILGGAAAGGFGLRPLWSGPIFLLNVMVVALCVSLFPVAQDAFSAAAIYGFLGGMLPFAASYWISRRLRPRRSEDAV